MAEDPKEFLRLNSERERKTQEQMLKARLYALKLVSTGEEACFYYPACGSDFIYPLQYFSDRCDTFVFCDWMGGDENSFLEWIKTINAAGSPLIPDDAPDFLHFPLDQTDVKDLANMEHILGVFFPDMPANLRGFLADPPSAKGHYAELWVTTRHGINDGPQKFVRVFWLAMEGVNTYWKLFTRNMIAPRILCINNWHHVVGAWAPFGNWQEYLGKVVQEGRCEPEFLVAPKGAPHDWPWRLPVKEFNWDGQPVMMWAKEKPASPN